MLSSVSKKVIDAVKARLSAVSTGFNSGITTNAATYGILNPLQLNFDATSQNFFLAQINPDLLEQTGIFTYPCACLYTLESKHLGNQKFTQFSGEVRCVFEVFLSWKNIRGKQDHESYGNCVEDVVFDVINRVENQNWGKPLTYNGHIHCKRGPLSFAAENFRQRLGFSMLFQLDQ